MLRVFALNLWMWMFRTSIHLYLLLLLLWLLLLLSFAVDPFVPGVVGGSDRRWSVMRMTDDGTVLIELDRAGKRAWTRRWRGGTV